MVTMTVFLVATFLRRRKGHRIVRVAGMTFWDVGAVPFLGPCAGYTRHLLHDNPSRCMLKKCVYFPDWHVIFLRKIAKF